MSGRNRFSTAANSQPASRPSLFRKLADAGMPFQRASVPHLTQLIGPLNAGTPSAPLSGASIPIRPSMPKRPTISPPAGLSGGSVAKSPLKVPSRPGDRVPTPKTPGSGAHSSKPGSPSSEGRRTPSRPNSFLPGMFARAKRASPPLLPAGGQGGKPEVEAVVTLEPPTNASGGQDEKPEVEAVVTPEPPASVSSAGDPDSSNA